MFAIDQNNTDAMYLLADYYGSIEENFDLMKNCFSKDDIPYLSNDKFIWNA